MANFAREITRLVEEGIANASPMPMIIEQNKFISNEQFKSQDIDDYFLRRNIIVNQAVEEGENSTGSSTDDTSRRGDLRRRSEDYLSFD